MADDEQLCICPSFSSYSADRMVEIASEVTEVNDGEDDFEFVLVDENQQVLSEEFWYNGQIKQIYPVFNRDLLENDEYSRSNEVMENIRVPLMKILAESRDPLPPSSSSSEADELESVPPGTYCVWRPKAAELSPSRQCKKSKSTGSASKRWKFRDLLRRSNSEGKEPFVFLTPKLREEKSKEVVNSKESKAKQVVAGEKSANQAFYVQRRTIREGDKKKSYLPYRQDLVGFFANANGLARNISFPTPY